MVKRGENESLINYFYRITRDRKELDLSYDQWQELLIGENKYISENEYKPTEIIYEEDDEDDKIIWENNQY